ncbi:hypothetical protein TWF696_001996 [Orbilia brochopaga]|uniref:Mis18 domain-containing protein n=1 Tax=Orbilia brochopaga TaxID=3140254 RepID=A0AAV9U9W7_9PEZI
MPPTDAAPAASAPASEDVGASVSKTFTIFCKHCQANLADSTDVDRIIAELKLMVLSREKSADLIAAEKNRKGGKGSKDEGSSYQDVNCNGCKHIVGRKYMTIAKYPDIQGKFALLQDEIDLRPHIETLVRDSNDGQHPEPASIPEEFTNIKRFCLMLHDSQESLRTQVAQLARQPLDRNVQVQQPEPHTCSCSKELEELKMRVASLQSIVERNNQLMAQMKLQSKRSYADFAVEIPVIRKRNDTSSETAQEQTLQQQHLSPPSSVMSAEKGDSHDDNGSKDGDGSLAGQVTAEEQPQPRKANPSGQMHAGSGEVAPIVITDGDDSDSDSEYQEGGRTPASRAAKRARLAKRESVGAKRGRGRPSLRSTTDDTSGGAPVASIATPKAQLDNADKDISSMSTGRVTRSRK